MVMLVVRGVFGAYHKDDQIQKSPRQMMLAQRSRNRDLRERVGILEAQRDEALSKLVDAHAVIVELTLENDRLRSQLPSSNITKL